MLGKQLQEARELTVRGFSELRSEAFPCISQGSLGNKFYEVHSPMHLLIQNFHDWPWSAKCKWEISLVCSP